MIFDHFPKISEDFPKVAPMATPRPHECFQTFSENFRRFPNIAEDFRGRSENVLMMHQQLKVQLKGPMRHRHYLSNVITVKNFLRTGNWSSFEY